MSTASLLTDRFFEVQEISKKKVRSDKMRGFKRSLTVYCQKKETETGTPARRFRAGVKAQISRRGGNVSTL